ncbi:MAG: ABC transporter permease [Lachnospiraceae bacterium]|nr:ABC transporter permease [Lachnospiraceae bacterium]
MQILKKFLKTKESAVILMFVVLFLGTAILQPALLTYPQLINLFRTISMSLLPAMGMVFVMTCGSIDLSAGSVLAFSGMLSGYAMVIWGWHPAFAVLLALGFSAITGLINGFLIARWGLTPMIVTLGVQYVVRGLVNVITKGVAISGFPEAFTGLGQGKAGAVPNPIIIAAVVFAICLFVYNFTIFGRSIISTGGNKETARLAGINVRAHIVGAHILCSVLAGMAGMLVASRLGSAQASAGSTADMYAIASAAVGGTSLMGGSGSIVGCLFGVGIMELITIALTLIKVDVYWQRTVVGIIMIAAVFMDIYRRNSSQRSGS